MEFKDLTPEKQEKVKACKTPEEVLALAKEEGYELTDEEIESISGGILFAWECDDYTIRCTRESC